MKSKMFFKAGSVASLIVFFVALLIGVLEAIEHVSRLWFAGSGWTGVLGDFEPVFSYIDIHFLANPELYDSRAFIALSFVNSISALLLIALSAFYMHKLLRNIHRDSLFMYENVSVFYKLGIVIIVLGTLFNYTESVMLTQAIGELQIVGASIQLTDISYVDSLISGFVMMIIASALKIAVNAVEENKNTI
ncbi:DUF2975 domain-containing protein [Paenibacillus macerans]|uniref:DUF2975 domain-containing protein n=1 Tax=Paenibacillus macerans TaxID=44252 RepID=A0A6N8EU26_PAEMA|nr:DUF2975 domain-containing protein [Paenibacillus macerans]MBS5912770.1 DUF2975 domain-containing protein [Paenibacillus macerans]MEC0141435.1 DUF2975 domain-containing protein [Paenibacillus macerans]MUG23165.1 DUF2975 domain-containing protein [Paenibacillus macerans]GBK61091.1 DUF2975 domain-containing protein [Paenibacillus macerans]GBK67393.1 DUF2975 domain-containing protein [Paenibacillus macerans]